MPDRPAFVLYVSSVEGRLVTRFGAGQRGTWSSIGARRSAANPTEILWDTEVVVALTVTEVARYAREYERALDAKALRKRTEEEYLAQLAREHTAPPPQAAAPMMTAHPPPDPGRPTAPGHPASSPAAPAANPPPEPDRPARPQQQAEPMTSRPANPPPEPERAPKP